MSWVWRSNQFNNLGIFKMFFTHCFLLPKWGPLVSKSYAEWYGSSSVYGWYWFQFNLFEEQISNFLVMAMLWHRNRLLYLSWRDVNLLPSNSALTLNISRVRRSNQFNILGIFEMFVQIVSCYPSRAPLVSESYAEWYDLNLVYGWFWLV